MKPAATSPSHSPEQAARTVRREAAVRERQVAAGSRPRRAAAACRPPRARRRPAAAPRKQRTAATSIPATTRYARETRERVERRPRSPRRPAPSSRSPPTLHRNQRQAGEQPAGQQQDAADLAAAVVASVPSGRLGWLRSWRPCVVLGSEVGLHLHQTTQTDTPSNFLSYLAASNYFGIASYAKSARTATSAGRVLTERGLDRLLFGVRLLGGGLLGGRLRARRRPRRAAASPSGRRRPRRPCGSCRAPPPARRPTPRGRA